MTKHYEWSIGETPPVLGRHSLAKHQVLRKYLETYVEVLSARPEQEQLKLTLVDGFSGGGAYLHPDTNDRLPGSPIIMLQAMQAAEDFARNARRKPFSLNAEYIFIDTKPSTLSFLENEIAQYGLRHGTPERVTLLKGSFSSHLDKTLDHVERRGRSRRVVFVLDQYGYTDVRMPDLTRIFQRLPNAEIILTLATDWLIDHCQPTNQFDCTLEKMGIVISSTRMSQMKQDNVSDGRFLIQHELHDAIFRASGASFYTPFFVYSPEAHRSYWLLHLSGHAKARDVMTQLHWHLQNHFEHLGGPGLGMLGYDPRRDLPEHSRCRQLFTFDAMARESTHHALRADIPKRLGVYSDGLTVGQFFNSVANETPATKSMICEDLQFLSREKDIIVLTQNRKLRQPGVMLSDDDIIKLDTRRRLITLD